MKFLSLTLYSVTLALKLNQHYSLDDLSFLWTTFPFTGSYSISTRYTQSLVYGSIRGWLVYGSVREQEGDGVINSPRGRVVINICDETCLNSFAATTSEKGKCCRICCAQLDWQCVFQHWHLQVSPLSVLKLIFKNYTCIYLYTSGAAFPRIKNLVESREVLLNSSVSINCSIEEGQLLHWLHNNVPNITATTPGYTMTGTLLTVTSFSLENSGEYRCAAYSQSSEGGETMVALSHITELSTFSKTPQFAAFSYTN